MVALFGAGAAGASAAGASAAAASTAAATTGAAATGAAISGAAASAAASTGAAIGATAATGAAATTAAAGGVAANAGAAAALTAAAAPAASTGGILAGIELAHAGLALSGLSTATSLFGGYRQSQQAEIQKNTQDLYARLDAANTQNESQRRLASVISMNNNAAAAIGLNANTGSLQTMKESSLEAAEKDQLGILSRRAIALQQSKSTLFANRSRAYGQSIGSVADFSRLLINEAA